MILSILRGFLAVLFITEVQDCQLMAKHPNHGVVDGLVLPQALEAAQGACQ